MARDSPPSLAAGPETRGTVATATAGGQDSDERLMAAYAAGSTDSLERLFDRYAPLLLNVLQRRMTDRNEAPDLVQQTFLQLHRARADFDPSRRFRPWIFSIALNVQREYFRSRGRHPATDSVDESFGEVCADAARVEAAWDIERALPGLSPEQREVVELHWLGDLTFPEVAAIVGATVSATRVRAHRAYTRLRALLEETPCGSECGKLRGRGLY